MKLARLIVIAALTLFSSSLRAEDVTNDGYSTDMIVLTTARPIWIRAQVTIGDLTLGEALRAQALQAFKFLDRDGNQNLTDIESQSLAEMYGIDVTEDANGSIVRDLFNLFRDEPAPEEAPSKPVSFEMFLEHWESNHPLLEITNNVASRLPEDDVFPIIDFDSDKFLTLAELQALPEALRRWDRNGDDKIATADLRQFINPFFGQTESSQTVSSTGAILVRSKDEMSDAAERMFELYNDERGGRRIRIPRLGLPEEKVRTFDADQDGELSKRELLQLLESAEPDLEITLRFPAWDAPSGSVELTCRKRDSADSDTLIVSESATGSVLQVGAVRLNLSAGWTPIAANDQLYAQQFTVYDSDMNKYLDKDEWKRTLYEPGAFAAVDRNNDEKVFEDEWVSYTKQLRNVSGAKLQCSDTGRSLFSTLDANSDQFLSIREQRNAARLLDEWDSNHDAKLSLEELPNCYDAAFSVGESSEAAVMRSIERENGLPTWFERLDRNRDGDLSRGEYPGPLELFDKLDSDADGLLSVNEAQSAQ